MELELADLLESAMQNIGHIQSKVAEVRQTGGDCKLAFLSVIPEAGRPQAEMQWPMIAMLLGA